MPEYNTARNKLEIREYGRNIQKMIEQAIAIEDRQKRNEAAKAIIKAMSMISPSLAAGTATTQPTNNNAQPDPQLQKQKESLDYWQKLWDHLIIISNYQLDIDSPFAKPEKEEEKVRISPKSEYQKTGIRVRSYGRYLDQMIQTVSTYPDGPDKVQLTKEIANQMKKLYLTWNRDTVEDSIIISQLYELSGGKLTLPKDFVFNTITELPATSSPLQPKKKKKRKKKRKNTATESL
jgi:hypothetical protein